MLEANDVQILHDLGLTILEAKVYMALVKTGKATITTIAKTSTVARPDVYRTLARLQEKGLAEKIIAIPNAYKPYPMKECILDLIEKKRRKFLEAQEKASSILCDFELNNSNKTVQEDKTGFRLIPEQTTVKKQEKTLSNVQKSYDVVTSWKDSHRVIFANVEGIADALQRGVKIRVIVDKPAEEKLTSDITKLLEKNSNFEISCLSNPPEALISIYDKTEARICTCTHPTLEKCSTLWTDNTCLLSILQDYFETKWHTAVKSKHQYFPQT